MGGGAGQVTPSDVCRQVDGRWEIGRISQRNRPKRKKKFLKKNYRKKKKKEWHKRVWEMGEESSVVKAFSGFFFFRVRIMPRSPLRPVLPWVSGEPICTFGKWLALPFAFDVRGGSKTKGETEGSEGRGTGGWSTGKACKGQLAPASGEHKVQQTPGKKKEKKQGLTWSSRHRRTGNRSVRMAKGRRKRGKKTESDDSKSELAYP